MKVEFKPISNDLGTTLVNFSKKHPSLFAFVSPFFFSMVSGQSLSNSTIYQVNTNLNSSNTFLLPSLMADVNSYVSAFEIDHPIVEVDIVAKRFHLTNMSFSSSFSLGDGLNERKEYVALAKSKTNSTYLTAWQVYGFNSSTGYTHLGQVRNENDQPLSQVFPISTIGIPDPYSQVRLASLNNGNFVAVWHSDHEDGTKYLYVQLIGFDGSLIGGVRRLTNASSSELFPEVQTYDEGFSVTLTREDPSLAPEINLFNNSGDPLVQNLRLHDDGFYTWSAFLPPDTFFTIFEALRVDPDGSDGILIKRSFKNGTVDPDPIVPYSNYSGWQRGGVVVPLLNRKFAATLVSENNGEDTLWLYIFDADTKLRILEYPIVRGPQQTIFFQKMSHKENTNELGVIWQEFSGVSFQLFEFHDETTSINATSPIFGSSDLDETQSTSRSNGSSMMSSNASSFISSEYLNSNRLSSSFNSSPWESSEYSSSTWQSSGVSSLPTVPEDLFLIYENLTIEAEYVFGSANGIPVGTFQVFTGNDSQTNVFVSLNSELEDGEELTIFLFASQVGSYDDLIVTTDDPCTNVEGEWMEEEDGSFGYYVTFTGLPSTCSMLDNTPTLAKASIINFLGWN